MIGLLAAGAVDVGPHEPAATAALLVVFAGVGGFFALRPELWRRMFLDPVDPRAAGLLRIVFGLVVLWAFVDLLPWSRLLFSDEGIWLTSWARKIYGGKLARLWDPEHGFAHGADVLRALWTRGSILHLRSDPATVFAVHGAALVAIVCMILGFWTRLSTLLAWVLTEQLVRVSPIYYNGGDLVVRIFLFLGIFCAWGEAYSLDAWRRRRRAIRSGARRIPALRPIAPWPLRLMMLQLVIIYTATGVLKSGRTWWDGTAMYYALNLDHFYRVPMTGQVAWAQRLGFLPVMTWLVHLWEMLFPLAAFGAALRAFDRDRDAGRWPRAPRGRRWLSWATLAVAWIALAWVTGLATRLYLPPALRPAGLSGPGLHAAATAAIVALGAVGAGGLRWLRVRAPHGYRLVRDGLLGKRSWLGFGALMHLGIDVTLNVGTFAQVMVAVYLAWLTPQDVDTWWRFVGTRPLPPGQGGRPARVGLARALFAPVDRLRHRQPRPRWVVRHAGDEAAIRRAALLRPWDLATRLDFALDRELPPGELRLAAPEGAALEPDAAGRVLARLLPGLWPLLPVALLPGLGPALGRLLWARRTR